MVNRRLFITISFMFVCHLIFSQKEANIWHFGDNAGIDFNGIKPVALASSKMYASEGCVSQSTYNGRLLFYTDGTTVWDSTHSIMPNGKDLLGSTASTQSSVIIPKPFSFKRYYIFTVDNVAGANGLCYSEIDMTYNKGKGDVIARSKNKKLLVPTCEKITAIKHANGIDYWIITHKFNSDLIFAYRVTAYGIVPWPVVSKTGFKVSGDYSNTLGYMKCSPDGRKLAYANYEMDTAVIADFNSNTGKVTNAWTFNQDDAYGIEFSPKSKYLYVGEFSKRKIFQYDAKASNKQDFLASRALIDSNYSNNLGALQIATDGKLYIAVTGSKFLQVIHCPDSSASMTLPEKDFLFLQGRICLLGLPNLSPSIFNKKTFTVARNCINDSAFFTINNLADIDSVWWYFDDPQSGIKNTSKRMTNVSHIYTKPGYYNVSLFYYYKNAFGWATFKFYVRNPKPYIGRDTGFCNAFKLTISPQRDYETYAWSNGVGNFKTMTVTQKGEYILKVTDSGGCAAYDTIMVRNPRVIADFSISDTIMCAKNNVFEFTDKSNYDDDSFSNCEWEFGDGTKLQGPFIKKEYQQPGKFKIKLTVESQNHCIGSVEKSIYVIPNPVAEFSFNNPCFPDATNFKNLSSVSAGKIITHFWDFGDKTGSIELHPVKLYEEAGKYSVKLSVISDKGCTDSIVKHRGIWVKPKPKAVFNFSEISTYNNGKRVIQMNNLSSEDATRFEWNFGKGNTSTEKNPVLNYIDSGENKFSLKVTNDAGCTDTFSLTTYHRFYFNLPNAFSPDGNGVNETYGPVSSLFVNTYKMEIFNRWGEKLFETTDLTQGWDGKYNGVLCADGIYVCKIAITPYNGVLQHFEDAFRLLR